MTFAIFAGEPICTRDGPYVRTSLYILTQSLYGWDRNGPLCNDSDLLTQTVDLIIVFCLINVEREFLTLAGWR